MSEGEFVKRVTGSTSEAVWVSALDQYGQSRGEMISKADYLRWVDEARKEFPIKGHRMELAETLLIRETTHLEFDRPTPKEFLELLRWFLKYFGNVTPKE